MADRFAQLKRINHDLPRTMLNINDFLVGFSAFHTFRVSYHVDRRARSFSCVAPNVRASLFLIVFGNLLMKYMDIVGVRFAFPNVNARSPYFDVVLCFYMGGQFNSITIEKFARIGDVFLYKLWLAFHRQL